MRKQELVQLHGLVALIRRYVSERHAVPADAFEAYDGLGADHTAIHYDKTTHKECVQHLLDGILTTIPDRREADRTESQPIKYEQ